MAENIKLEIVTPEKIVVDEEAQIVVSPGTQGEFGVLTGHTTFLSTLKAGSIHYTDENGDERYVFVSGGFAEALPDKVTILAESAERRSDIDRSRAQSAFGRAQDRLDSDQEHDMDVPRAKAAMIRALARLKITDINQ